jgi:hypothetical protein
MSDAAAALAVLTQQQQQVQAQAQAQQAAAVLAARLSMDAAAARSSMDAAAAAATTQAMLQAGAAAGLPPRMSLDSLLATRTAAPQQGWAPPAAPAATTAAAALAGGAALPLNEQPFPQGNAPRMSNAGACVRVCPPAAAAALVPDGVCSACRPASQPGLFSTLPVSSPPLYPPCPPPPMCPAPTLPPPAVARKLGLAPQRSSLDARLTKLRGVATPPRSSLDGILHALQQSHSARSSLDQQQAMLQAMAAGHNPQLQAMAGLNSMGPGGAPQMAPHHMNGGGGYPPVYPVNHAAASAPGAPNGYGHGMPAGAGPDNMPLHPALLSLVAAQMAPQQSECGRRLCSEARWPALPACFQCGTALLLRLFVCCAAAQPSPCLPLWLPPHLLPASRTPHPPPAAVPGMPPGVPNGMHSGLGAQHGGDANMAALMESLHSWQLNGGGHGGGGMQHNGGGHMHSHRASMEGMTGVAGAAVSTAQHSILLQCGTAHSTAGAL